MNENTKHGFLRAAMYLIILIVFNAFHDVDFNWAVVMMWTFIALTIIMDRMFMKRLKDNGYEWLWDILAAATGGFICIVLDRVGFFSWLKSTGIF